MSLVSINPVTNERIRAYEEMTAGTVASILDEAHAAHVRWRTVALADRARLLRRVAETLRERTNEYAQLMTLEMGKPIVEARAEAEKCAWVCEYYAEHGESFLSPQYVETEASKNYVAFEPVGIVLAVMPWNFPFWQVIRFAAPALMAGNAAVLKHASNVMGCALAIEELFLEAGFPRHLFRSLRISSGQVASVIEHPRVAAVTLTGSTPAGKAVASTAGAMLKKSVLELGGSDPYIILADADVDGAVAMCVTSRLINGGQSCVAAKRFIVVETLADEFETRCVELMRGYTVGDPLDEKVDVGPLARVDLRDELHEQVQASIERGARLLLGGAIPDGAGAFYPPTVLAGVSKGMPAYDDELFGPVAAIIVAKDDRDAITIANDSPFGLGAAVFTKDVKRGEEIAAKELQAGLCFVNGFVKSDPRLPFGGTKASGYGRELGEFGMREFVNIKTVHIA